MNCLVAELSPTIIKYLSFPNLMKRNQIFKKKLFRPWKRFPTPDPKKSGQAVMRSYIGADLVFFQKSTRGPRFDSHQHIIISLYIFLPYFCCLEKTKRLIKRPGVAHLFLVFFLKNRSKWAIANCCLISALTRPAGGKHLSNFLYQVVGRAECSWTMKKAIR